MNVDVGLKIVLSKIVRFAIIASFSRGKTILEHLGSARFFINQTFPGFSSRRKTLQSFIYRKVGTDPSRSNIIFLLGSSHKLNY